MNTEFAIYRKPAHTDVTINSESNRPWSHKVLENNSMIRPPCKKRIKKALSSKLQRLMATNSESLEDRLHDRIDRKQANKLVSGLGQVDDENIFRKEAYIGATSDRVMEELKKKAKTPRTSTTRSASTSPITNSVKGQRVRPLGCTSWSAQCAPDQKGWEKMGKNRSRNMQPWTERLNWRRIRRNL